MKSTFLLLCCLFLATTIFTQNLSAQFDELMQAGYKADGPGATVLVAQKGRIIYHKAFGLANLELNVPLKTDHVFRIGSVTKQFTVAAILQLAEQGKLSLQDELTKFIPDYPTQGKRITVEQLLNHTSGIKSYTGMAAWDAEVQRRDFTPSALIDYFKNQPMDFEPGAEFRYNNSGYILLGFIIETVSGEPYGTYIAEHIFKPLGMQHSYYGDVAPIIPNRAAGYSQADGENNYTNAAYLSMSQPYAAGSLLSTVEDLYIWTKALHSGKVISAESLKKATTPLVLPNKVNTHYGFGLEMDNLLGSSTVEHGGGIHGFLSHLVYLPKEDICVAILTNCDCNSPSEVASKMAALVAGKNINPTPIAVAAKDLEQYVGVYENEQQEQRIISLEENTLYSQRKGGGKIKLIPTAKDQFAFDARLARATFVQEKGKVTKVLVDDHTAPDNLWVKTDKPLPTAIPELQLAPAEMEKFIGIYELMPGFNITVTQEENQLFCQATGQPRFEIFAKSPTRFFLKVVEADIEFYPDAQGSVPTMVLFQNGQEMKGKRVK